MVQRLLHHNKPGISEHQMDNLRTPPADQVPTVPHRSAHLQDKQPLQTA